MTGLVGFSSGYRAMEHCDALVMLGTDFPYRPFFPDGVPVIQVDARGEQIGRRVPVTIPLVGTYGTSLDNSGFAAIARDSGLFAARVEKASELDDALRAAFNCNGPALVDVATARHELSLPPS